MGNTVTFEELAALAIDTSKLPPMDAGRGSKVRRTDRTRSNEARRVARSRRKQRALKYADA